MNDPRTEDTEFCINMYDYVDGVFESLFNTNFGSSKAVESCLPLVHELIDTLRHAFEKGFELKASDLTKKQRGRLGIFTPFICEWAMDKKNPELLNDAMAVANITYEKYEWYHELHYDMAILRYCAHRLGVSFDSLGANPPWGLTDEVKERFDDIGGRPMKGLLDSFKLQVSKVGGKFRISQERW